MRRRPPRSTQRRSSAASDVYKRQPRACASHLYSPPRCGHSHQEDERSVAELSMDTGGRFARVGLAGMSERHLPDILSIERESFNLPWTENMFLAELGNPDGWTR